MILPVFQRAVIGCSAVNWITELHAMQLSGWRKYGWAALRIYPFWLQEDGSVYTR